MATLSSECAQALDKLRIDAERCGWDFLLFQSITFPICYMRFAFVQMVLSFGKLMDCEVVTCDYGRDSQGLEPVNIYRV